MDRSSNPEFLTIDAPGLVDSDQKLQINKLYDEISGTPVTHGTIGCVPSVDGSRVRMLLCDFGPILARPLTCYVRFPEANYSPVNQRRIDNGGPNGDASPAVQGLRKITLDRVR